MKVLSPFVLTAVVALIGVAPSGVSAQVVTCGQIINEHDLRQVLGLVAVQLVARSSRDFNSCPLKLQVEAWVNGVGSASVNTGLYAAEVNLLRAVPRSGVWTSTSKHWVILLPVGVYEFLGTLFGETTVEPPGALDRKQMCELEGGRWEPRLQRCVYNTTPIIADPVGDGYDLTGVDDGVLFDLDADGLAERVAWTAADSDDAFLAMDRNGNGRIDDGAELFGDHTPAYARGTDPLAANGFEALKFSEGPSYGGGRADGVIDERDAVFSRLLLWRDANHNGLSEPGELTPVVQSSLLSIGTNYTSSRRRDEHGNEFRLRAMSSWRTPSGRAVRRFVHDVWLTTR